MRPQAVRAIDGYPPSDGHRLRCVARPPRPKHGLASRSSTLNDPPSTSYPDRHHRPTRPAGLAPATHHDTRRIVSRGTRTGKRLDSYALPCIYTVMHIYPFEMLADPTRRHIVEALRGGERQVNDIVRQVGIHQSGVSRHLRILQDSGFVSMRPLGQCRLYALRPEPFRELEAWLAEYRQLWDARLDRFGAALEGRRKDRNTAGK